MDERSRIALVARVLGGGSKAADVEVGIGDDAAVLDPRGARRLVWTVDEQVEGVHFRRDLASWRDVGWRSYMAAASDVAAMGADPWCALAALVVPAPFGDDAFEDVLRGQREAAEAVGAPVVGGNLSRGAAVSIATTFLGRCDRAVARSGAKEGDALWVAGDLGRAAAGLAALERKLGDRATLAGVVEAWRRPRALVVQGRAMASVAHACIDVSDGLARDAGHVADASGVCVVIDEAALRSDDVLVSAAGVLGLDPTALALHGGEDYALVVASDVPPVGFRRIGDVRVGRGVVLRGADGERPIEVGGFDHFA